MKKAYELSVLTGTQVLLLVVSETGLVYTFTTPKLQPLVTKSEGKNLIQACLNAPEEGLGDDQENQSDGNTEIHLIKALPQQPIQMSWVLQVMLITFNNNNSNNSNNNKLNSKLSNKWHQCLLMVYLHIIPILKELVILVYPPQQQGQHQPGIPLQGGYSDQYLYFGNIQNNNIPNQQQYQ